MSEPQYTQFTERMYARLPEVMREADALNGYALKHYISAIGDVQDQVERLIARFMYLSKQDRLGLDQLADDHGYYDLDWRYFQSTDSKNSAVISSSASAFLRTQDAYRVVPNTIVYAGAVFRTDSTDPTNAHGLRLWYYDAAMEPLTFRDVATGNGGRGPQWWALNATDEVPSEAYYIRVSPWSKPTSGTVRVWVDDVYVRSHYEVSTTNNLVSGGHNFVTRAERELVLQGDFDSQREALYMVDALRAQADALDAAGIPTVGPNLVRDPTTTGSTAGWLLSVGTSDALTIEDRDMGNGVVTAMRHLKIGHTTISGDYFTIDPTMAYEFRLTFDKPEVNLNLTSDFYFGINAIDASGAQLPVEHIYTSSGATQTNGSNFYFWNAPGPYDGPQEIVGYVLPYGTDPMVAKGLGSGRYNAIITDPATSRLRPRFLNYANADMELPVWVSNVSVRAVRVEDITAPERLRAQADQAEQDSLLSAWDRGPSTALVEKDLSGVPDVQSYRTWLNLASTNADQPGYARQVLQGLAPDATYDVSLLMVREADTPDDATLRITITPDTGGPTAKTFTLTDYDTETPHLLTYTWNSPETVSTAIINVEYIAPAPSSGLLINDISVVRYLADVSQIGREGASVTSHVLERAGETILGSGSVTSSAWARVDPSTLEELETGDQGPATGVSYMHRAWHPTRPGNRYDLTGEFFTDHSGAYVDLTILYRIEGKGWGEQMLHRVSATPVSTWVQFTRAITIPPAATEFRVIVSPYRSGSTRRTEVRNLALASPTDRSWYAAGSRPFAFAALASRSMNFLSRGDLLHYSANLMVTGDPSYGRYGIRIYARGGQVVHETVVTPRMGDGLVKVVGAFQVPESLIDLRAVLYVDDPTPKHQAAYFLSELEIVHSSQRFVEDPQNLIRNGGFEFTNALEGWNLLAERETVRRNLVPNPIGPSAVSASGWRTTTGDTLTLVQDGGRPALKLIEGGTGTGLYMDPEKNYPDIPVGSTIRFSADVKVTADIDQMRLTISPYNGAVRTGGSTGWLTQTPADGWVRHTVEAVVTEAPEGSYFRMLVWPANDSYPAGQGFLVRDAMIEIDTNGKFFDRYTPDTALSTYSWDGEAHVARTLAHEPPAALPMSVSTDTGYNREDVPDRPDGVPLGSTSDLVDPRTANTEWLPWLSQFAGHNINHFSSLEEARNAFASTESNFAAGTIGAIQNAVGAVLTGTRTVRVFPMTTRLDQVGQASQWDIAIVTRTSESPDVSVMEEAVSLRNAKPVGVVFHFFKHQSTWDAVELAYPTWTEWDKRNWTQIEEAGLAEG